MPITFEQQPPRFAPASNPCVFVFESPIFYAQENFSFLVTLKINGSDHSVHQVFLESGKRGRFDATEIIRTLLQSPIENNDDLAQPYSTAFLTYSIEVDEKFSNPPTDPPAPNLDPVASNEKIAFNGSLRYSDWLSFNYIDHLVDTDIDSGDGVYPRLFLTNYPRPSFPFKGAEFCSMSQQKFLGVLTEETEVKVEIRLFDIDNNQLNFVSTPITTSEKLFLINCSPENIIEETTLTALDFDAAYRYSVRFLENIQGSFQSSTEDYQIIIDRDCERYEHKRLTWLNKFGVWDSFTFKLRSKESTTVERNKYKTSVGQWDENNDFIFPTYQGENKTAFVTSEDTIEINSDWISEDVQNWLSESLLESPKVYLETSDGFELLIPETKGFNKKKRFSDGLIQESYKFRRTYTYKSQLG